MKSIKIIATGLFAFLSCKTNSTYTQFFKTSEGTIKETFNSKNILIEHVSYYPDTPNKHGESKYYYDNGALLRVEYWNRNVRSSDYVEYYSNGHPKLYVFYDIDGDTLFYRKYSKNNAITDEKGSLDSSQLYTYRGKLKDSIMVYLFYFIYPPETEAFVKRYLVSGQDTIKPFITCKNNVGIRVSEFKIKHPGQYTYCQSILFYDSLNKLNLRFSQTVKNDIDF